MIECTEPERIMINHLQGGFPVVPRPFQDLEGSLGLSATEQLRTLEQLRDRGLMSRFGAVINTRALGGDSRLAAMPVPESRLEETIEFVNQQKCVTHNYLRDHELNLWFVLSARDPSQIDDTLDVIRQNTGIRVFNLPKETEFYVGLKFHISKDGRVRTENRSEGPSPHASAVEGPPNPLSERGEHELIRAIQDGLPLDKRPFRRIAEDLSWEESTVLQGLRSMLQTNKIKRLGIVPNHYGLGIRGNAMTVMDVPDDQVRRVGERLGKRPEVTHCYRRPRHRPIWPYNLFAMVHERTREEARRTVSELRGRLNITEYPCEVLFSRRLLKKTGLRLP